MNQDDQDWKSFINSLRGPQDLSRSSTIVSNPHQQIKNGGEGMTQTATISKQAIQDWKKYPELAKVFEDINQYADYLADDFESHIARKMKEKSCSKAQAIRETISANPGLHKQWLSVVNIIGNGGK